MAEYAPSYFVGDSIAQGLQNAAGGQGDTKVGRSPAAVLSAINGGPSLNGQNVVLSTGLSNNPNDVASAQAQIAALKAKGAGSISVVGLGSRFNNLNPTVAQIAQSGGATFAGGFASGPDGVHPASYGTTLASTSMPARPTSTPNYAPSYSSSMTPLDYTAHIESGDRNIPQAIHDINTEKGTPAQGNWQIIDPTWKTYAARAGVDLNKYPSAITAPRNVQAQVAALIPGTQFGPNTQAALRAKFPGIDLSKPIGSYGGSSGGAGNPAGAPPGVAMPSAAPGGVGGALAALNMPTDTGKSTLQNAGSMTPDTSQPAPTYNNLEGQMAAASGNVRQAQIAQSSAQLAAALQASSSKPLTWSAAPFGSNAGPQVPGATLNSTGGLYG